MIQTHLLNVHLVTLTLPFSQALLLLPTVCIPVHSSYVSSLLALLHADMLDCLLSSILPSFHRAIVPFTIQSHIYNPNLSPRVMYNIHLMLQYDLTCSHI